MARRNITLDARTERLIARLVPKVWPSRSEMIRDLVRKEAERRLLI